MTIMASLQGSDTVTESLSGLPLDSSLYNSQDGVIEFFKTQTGINDDGELQNHILAVQEEAYAVHPYPCIRRLAFTSSKISRFKSYEAVLKIGRDRPDAILLDLGCCVGADTRKVIADGYPRDSVIASDIHPEFWPLGHKLFRSSSDTFPVPFIPGDIFDPEFLAPTTTLAPSGLSVSLPSAPPLTQVRSLTQLQHQISVLHASSFFHLFGKEKQRSLAHLLGSLLSPIPGSMLFGSHMGVSDSEENIDGGVQMDGCTWVTFGHSPTSWEEMWVGEGGVFKPGEVIVSARAIDVDKKLFVETGADPAYRASLLAWSVTRV